MKGSFFTSLDETKGFFTNACMWDQEGIYVSYLTDPQVLKKIVPPQMVVTSPVVWAYVINIGKPTFSSQYNEAAIGIHCNCEGREGIYWLSFMLSGEGKEMATFGGREVAGIPKKLADDITISRNGKYARATVTRHNIKIFDVELDISGQYNNSAVATKILGDWKPGDEFRQNCFFYKFDFTGWFTDATLRNSYFATTYHTFEKGLASVSMEDSVDDPWSELKVVEMLGGAYVRNDCAMPGAEILGTVKAPEIMPYLMSGRFDRGTMTNWGNTYFSLK